MARNLCTGERIGRDRLIHHAGIELVHEDNEGQTYRAWCHVPLGDCGPDLVHKGPVAEKPSIRVGCAAEAGAGALLELEEPKLYGLWDGRKWWRDGTGVVFATGHKGHAYAQLRWSGLGLLCESEGQWRVREIDPHGRPVDAPFPCSPPPPNTEVSKECP